jgi:hypothetical protein
VALMKLVGTKNRQSGASSVIFDRDGEKITLSVGDEADLSDEEVAKLEGLGFVFESGSNSHESEDSEEAENDETGAPDQSSDKPTRKKEVS